MAKRTTPSLHLNLTNAPTAPTMTHNYPYIPIEESQFRILRLQPAASHSAPLVAKLNICEREPALEYEALSYVWGQDDCQHEDLRIESTEDNPFTGMVRFRIRQSLVLALKHFRDTRDERLLWTDAICIDQNSDDEKSLQVPMMEKVYSRAVRVLVWLGKATEESDIAFSFMRRIVEAEDFDELITKESNTATQWKALESLMRNEWFTRRWIVQEIALARDAEIWCGDESISWADFCHVVDLFKLYYPDIKPLFLTQEHGYARNKLGEVEALGACQLVNITNNLFMKSNDGQIERRLITLESLVSRLTMFHTGRANDTIYGLVAIAKDIRTGAQPVKSIQPDASPVQTPTTRAPEGGEMPGLPRMSSPLLSQLRGVINKAMETKDHLKVPSGTEDANGVPPVVAGASTESLKRSASLTVPQGPETLKRRKKSKENIKLVDVVDIMRELNPQFLVNYQQTFHKVCLDFVEFAIRRSSSLDVILRPWVPEKLRQEHKLPSWLISVERYPYQQDDKGVFRRVNGDPLVGLNAMEPKRYGACGPTAPALPIARRDNTNPENGWGFCCKDRESAFSCRNGDHRSLFVTGFIFDSIGEITYPAAGGTIPGDWFKFCNWNWRERSEPPPPDLWRTLVAGREADGSHLPSYYRKTLHSIARKRCTLNGALNVQSILETPQYDKRSERVLNRIFAITPNRRLFKTTAQTGYHLGLASEKAEKGDKVCILYGCSVPVILRGHEETIDGKVCRYYELIGDAFVNGVMEGHAVDENERSESRVKSQQFELR